MTSPADSWMCRRRRFWLQATTALTSIMLAGAMPAHAQSISGSGDVLPAVPAPPLPEWDAGPVLTVGATGSGELAVEGGGKLVSSVDSPGFVGTYIGRSAGADGTVTVSGTDSAGNASTWENAGFLSVGYYGTGALNIEDGGRVSSLWARIGTNTGSTGTVTVSGIDAAGNASTWETGSVMVGRAGTGTLTIENGGRVAIGGDWSMLGWLPGSEGTLNVTGSDGAGHASTFEGPSSFRVGYGGTGALNVTDGAHATTGESKIGFRAGSVGTAVVWGTDAGGKAAQWDNSSALVIGSQGQGTLTVGGGGKVTSLSGSIGEAPIGTGSVTVSGTGASGGISTWEIQPSETSDRGWLYVGERGRGALTITDGGLVSGPTEIGAEQGGNGTVIVSGTDASGRPSTLEAGSFLQIGLDPGTTGTLIVENGGRVNGTRPAFANSTSVGYYGTGSIRVSGTASDGTPSTINGRSLAFGNEGNGTMLVEGGGQVFSDYGQVSGTLPGTTSRVRVTGTDAAGNPSLWSIANEETSRIDVGGHPDSNSGVTVSDGGRLVTGRSILGFYQQLGIATVTGISDTGVRSTWESTEDLTVGDYGGGRMSVRDGGRLISANGYIGREATGVGSVTVSGINAGGTPSTWENSGQLVVGGSGSGTLTIADGGKVIVSNRRSSNFFAEKAGSTGTVTVTGSAARGKRSTLDIGGYLLLGAKGAATLAIEQGGLVKSQRVSVGDGTAGSMGTVTVSGSDAYGNASSWQIDTLKVLGDSSVTVSGGGLVSNYESFIANRASVRVSGTDEAGAPSRWVTSIRDVTLYKGSSLTVEGGGEVRADVRADNGDVLVSGASEDGGPSSLHGSVSLANFSSMVIEKGGLVEGSAGMERSTVTVSGTDANGNASTWDIASDLNVGSPGSLFIEGGGRVSNANSRAFGTTLVTGTDANGNASTWENTGRLLVSNSEFGVSGTSGLTIEKGGKLTSVTSQIGNTGGVYQDGIVTVRGGDTNGNASTWQNAERISVGESGKGTLSIVEGGKVATGSLTIAPSGYTNTVTTVSGMNADGRASMLDIAADIIVGGHGRGTLRVQDGGQVTSATGYIGHGLNGDGTVTVSGTDANGEASSWQNSGNLSVGYSGKGNLSITDGGRVTSAKGYLGYFYLTSSGTVTVSGTDATGNPSTWENSDSLLIGRYGTGTLNLADDGVVSVGGGAGSVALTLDQARATGVLNIGAAAGRDATAPGELQAGEVTFGSGAATLVFNHTGDGYQFAPILESVGGGTHAISHLAGTTELTGDSSSFFGTTVVSDGTLVVAGQLGGVAEVTGLIQGDGEVLKSGHLQVDGSFLGDVTVRSSGVLSGSGTIDGDITFRYGRLAGVQGETLRINGDLELDDITEVYVALGAAVPSAALFDVGGDLRLQGELYITDQGGFGAGVYRLFDYGGTFIDDHLYISSVPSGVDPRDLSVQTAVAHQVNLLSSSGARLGFWDGGAGGVVGSTIEGGSGVLRAGALKTLAATPADPFQPNPTFAVFQGTPGTVTVDGSDGAIGVTGMQFASDGYRIQGDPIALQGAGGETILRVGDGTRAGVGISATIASELTGDSRLVKTDLGRLVLEGANSYAGGTRIDAGVLSVATDANLGDEFGALVLNGGTLATTGNIEIIRPLALTATSTVDVAAGTRLGLSGDGSGTRGAGDLHKTGKGTLGLFESDFYRNLVVEEGTVEGNTIGIVGNIQNAGTVVIGNVFPTPDRFEGDITGYGGVRGQMVLDGGGTLVLGGVSSLDWLIDQGQLRTAAERFTGNATLDWHGSLAFDQAADATYAGRIAGPGRLYKMGSGALLFDGDGSGFAGRTAVASGELIVGSDSGRAGTALGGSFDVGRSATLGGHGTVGSGVGSTVTVGDGGTLSPGHSIGTLTVKGDLALQPGSTLLVEVDPLARTGDKVHVTGTAQIEGGKVAQIGPASGYRPHQSYTILSADGGVSGSFASVSSAYAFLDPALSYTAGTVALELTRNDLDFSAAAATDGQAATADAIDSIGYQAQNRLYDAVAMLPDDLSIVRSSYDQLSGGIYPSTQSVLMENSHFLRDAVTGRLRAAFGGVAAPMAPVMAYDGSGVKALPADSERGAFWAYGFGSWGSFDTTGNAAAVDSDVGGFFLGADAPVPATGLGGDWRFGVVAGYSSTSFDVDGLASSGDSTDWHVGLYGGGQYGPLGIRLGLAYSWSDLETARAVAIPGFTDQLNGDTNAGTFQVFGDVGYRFEAGAASLEPFASLAYVSLDTDGFTERGGAAALSAAGADMDTSFTTLGLRASTTLAIGTAEAVLSGTVGWRHAFGDTLPASTLAFAGSDAFTVAGVPIAEDAAVVEAGLDFTLSDTAALGVAYQGQFGGGVTQNGFNATLSIKF